MHATYYRPGGVYRDLPERMPQYRESPWRKGGKLKRFNAWREGSMLDYLERFASDFPKRVDEYETLLTDNRIWKQRTVGIGVIPPEQALAWGMTGPMLRGSGIAWDLRKKQPYAKYAEVDFDIPVGVARRLLRPLPGARRRDAPVHPHHRAVRALAEGQPGPGDAGQLQGVAAVARRDEGRHGSADPSLQAVHAKAIACRPARPTAAVEAPKGEFGCYLVSRRRQQAVPRAPARAGFRAPVVDGRRSSRGHMLADVVAMIGTYDIVFGEIDR